MRRRNLDAEFAQIGRELGEALKKMRPMYLQYGTVGSVDEQTRTAEVVVDSNIVHPVSLDVLSGAGNSIFVLPKVDSLVAIGYIEGQLELPFLVMTTTLDKIVVSNTLDNNQSITVTADSAEVVYESTFCRMEPGKISMTSDLLEINKGNLGGMVKVESITSKITAIEQQLNSLKAVFAGWVPMPYDGGDALKKAAAAWAGEMIALTTRSELENIKVKQ